jgi:AraC-like DNA-binding protein
MSAFVLEYGQGALPRLAMHRNHGLEIIYILRGHMLWQTRSKTEQAPAGSVYFTLPEDEHGSAEEFEPGHEWVFVVLAPPANLRKSGRAAGRFLHPGLGFSPGEARRITSDLLRSRRHAFPGTPCIKWILTELVAELKRAEGAEGAPFLHEAKVAALARAAVVELARCVRAGGQETAPNVQSGVANRVRKLIDELIAHPEEPQTLGELARRCKLSRTQFAELFRRQTGDTPVKFLNRMRFRAACRMLRETSLPVTRIALECGFGTSQYFAKTFKAFSGGLSARAYRKGS